MRELEIFAWISVDKRDDSLWHITRFVVVAYPRLPGEPVQAMPKRKERGALPLAVPAYRRTVAATTAGGEAACFKRTRLSPRSAVTSIYNKEPTTHKRTTAHQNMGEQSGNRSGSRDSRARRSRAARW